MSEVVTPPETLNEAMNDVKAKITKMDEIITNLGDKINKSNNKTEKKILEKYKNYVEYLKEILETKLKLDTNITDVQKNVFQKLNTVFSQIQGFAILNLKDFKNNISKLRNKNLKRVLIDIDKIERKDNLFKELKCELVVDKLEKVLEEYEQELRSLNTTTTGGANSNSNNSLSIFTSSVNSNNSVKESYMKNLNKIKENYETGLKNSITQFNSICDALKNLFKSCIEIINKLIEHLKTNKKLKNELNRLQGITGNDMVSYVGLNLKNFNDTEKLFSNNKDALESMMKQITNAQTELESKNNTIDNSINRQQLKTQDTGQQNQNTGQQSQRNNTSSTTSETNSLNTVISDLNNVKNSDDIPKNINENMKILQDLSVKLNKLYNTNTNADKLRKEFQNIPPIPNGSIPTGNITISDSSNIDRYNRIVTKINKANSRIDQLAIYIYVMKKYQDADDIKKKLYLEVRNNGLFTGINKITLEKIQQTGGKYKMKKSKKSKSKTSKTTSKKANSTKKPKTTRTQTKSYNNPKYKNQDGGFVRGGVLFPESFYRSDIVM